MGDCVFEEDQVHLDELRLSVVLFELVDEIISKLFKVCDFFIDSHVFIKEVNEDSIFSISLAVLLVVHLEHLLQLLVQVCLELVTVLKRVQSVVENT